MTHITRRFMFKALLCLPLAVGTAVLARAQETTPVTDQEEELEQRQTQSRERQRLMEEQQKRMDEQQWNRYGSGEDSVQGSGSRMRQSGSSGTGAAGGGRNRGRGKK